MDSDLQMTLRVLNHDLGRILEEKSGSDLWNIFNSEIKRRVEEISRVFEKRSEEIFTLDPNLWGTLDVCMLEKIFTSLPLKDLIRSQVLSSTWRVRFHSPDFKAEVDRVSSRWVSYYPLCLSKNSNSTCVVMGYDHTCHTWQKLFTLPRFTDNFGSERRSLDFGCKYIVSPKWTRMLSGVIGSLFVSNYFLDGVLHIFVTNPINKFVRRLPPLDFSHDRNLKYDDWPGEESVLYGSSDRRMCEILPIDSFSARILVFSRKAFLKVLQVRAYDSNLNRWTKPVRGPQLQHKCFRLVLNSIVLLGNVFYLSFIKSKTKFYDPDVETDEYKGDDENKGYDRDETENEDQDRYNLPLYFQHVMVLYTYHTEEAEFKQIVLPILQDIPDLPIRSCRLAVLGTELFFLVQQGSQDQDEEQRQEWIAEDRENRKDLNGMSYFHPWAYIQKGSFLLLKLDPKSLQLTEISRGPSKKLKRTTFTGKIHCDQNFIYLKMKFESHADQDELGLRRGQHDALARCEFGVLMFDMHQQVWSYVSPYDMLEHRRARPPKGVNVLSLQKSSHSHTGLKDPTFWTWMDFSFQPGVNPFVTL